MNKKKFLILLVVFCFVFTIFIPSPVVARTIGADAKLAKLKVNNKTSAAINLILQGSKYYSLSIPVGNSKHEIQPGKYEWSFTLSGVTSKGKINISGNDNILRLYKITHTVKVVNKAGDVRIVFTGPKNYTFTLNNGTNKVELVKGKYSYTYTACGETQTGKLDVKGSAIVLRIDGCGKIPHPVPLTVVNMTDGYLNLTMEGPGGTYAFYIPPKSSQTKTVITGEYSYIAKGCGGSTKRGAIKIKRANHWSWYCR